MDAKSFLDKHGKAIAEQVAILAGSNYAYFSHIAYGHRRPSVDKAEKFVAACEAVIEDPAERLDFDSLVRPPRRETAPLPRGEAAA